ncbi:DUF2147 domain-containing protein [Chitinophagaceae bacterium LWZ2-11]
MLKRLLLLTIVMCAFKTINAQKDQIEHIWYNEEKTSKIQIYKGDDGKYYGKIVWLQTPNDKKGKPRTDEKNPNPKYQIQPLLNLVILKDFTKTNDVYENGTVYDPNSGKTYCGKLTYSETEKEIKLRGYICSFSLFGRSSTWTLAD